MKISLQNYLRFEAHFYDVDTAQGTIMIKTDNNPYLGEKPKMLLKDRDSSKHTRKEGDFFTYVLDDAPKPLKSIKYKFHYTDTDKYDDNNGDWYKLDTRTLRQKAQAYDKTEHKQPLIKIISPGKACGKLVCNSALHESAGTHFTLFSNNKNATGIILINTSMDILSHTAASLRSSGLAAVSIYDEEKINELKKLDGKYIEINVSYNDFTFKETEKIMPEYKTKHKIEIPRLKPVDKLLSISEISKDNTGAKAYNLK